MILGFFATPLWTASWLCLQHLALSLFIGSVIGVVSSFVHQLVKYVPWGRHVMPALLEALYSIAIVPLLGLMFLAFNGIEGRLIVILAAIPVAFCFFTVFRQFLSNRYERYLVYKNAFGTPASVMFREVLLRYSKVPLLEAFRFSFAPCALVVLTAEYFGGDQAIGLGKKMLLNVTTGKGVCAEVVIALALVLLPCLCLWLVERYLRKKWALGNIRGMADEAVSPEPMSVWYWVNRGLVVLLFLVFFAAIVPFWAHNGNEARMLGGYQRLFSPAEEGGQFRFVAYTCGFVQLLPYMGVTLVISSMLSCLTYWGYRIKTFDICLVGLTALTQTIPLIVLIGLSFALPFSRQVPMKIQFTVIMVLTVFAPTYRYIRDDLNKLGDPMQLILHTCEKRYLTGRIFFRLWGRSLVKSLLYVLPQLIPAALIAGYFYHVALGDLFYASTKNSFEAEGLVTAVLLGVSMGISDLARLVQSRKGWKVCT